MTKKEYITHNAYSYSSLSRISISPSYFKNKITEDTTGLTIGSAVDCLLTSPSEFNDQFHIANINKPTGQMGDFVTQLLACEQAEDCYEIAYELAGFKRDSLDKVIERFEKEGKDYYEHSKSSIGKKVLTKDEYTIVQSVVNVLKNNKYTRGIFNNDNLEIDVIYQLPVLYTNYEVNLDFKALFDAVVINHFDRTIKSYDLKTTGKSVLGFADSFMKFRYYLQNSMYNDAISKWAKDNYPEYTCYLMKHIAVESSKWAIPMIYDFSNFNHMGRYGGYYRSEWYKGYLDLARELDWHKKQDLWEYPKDIYDRGERIVLYDGSE